MVSMSPLCGIFLSCFWLFGVGATIHTRPTRLSVSCMGDFSEEEVLGLNSFFSNFINVFKVCTEQCALHLREHTLNANKDPTRGSKRMPTLSLSLNPAEGFPRFFFKSWGLHKDALLGSILYSWEVFSDLGDQILEVDCFHVHIKTRWDSLVDNKYYLC